MLGFLRALSSCRSSSDGMIADNAGELSCGVCIGTEDGTIILDMPRLSPSYGIRY